MNLSFEFEIRDIIIQIILLHKLKVVLGAVNKSIPVAVCVSGDCLALIFQQMLLDLLKSGIVYDERGLFRWLSA